jgi:hypothetical protein
LKVVTDNYTLTTPEGMVELYTQLAGIYHTLKFAAAEGPPLEHHYLVHEALGLFGGILK